MKSNKTKILGISGSPIKGGNCDKLVQAALSAAAEIEGIETEFITLADKNIGICIHCQWCIENHARCKIKDDVHEVHDKMFEADGLILGGPTYNHVLSTQMVNLFNRGREELFFGHRVYNKGIPGGAVTLGWFGAGMESALSIITNLMESWGIFPVGAASAITSSAWKGGRADYQPNGVLDDQRGVYIVKEMVGRRLAKIAKMMKYARDAGLNAAYGMPDKKE